MLNILNMTKNQLTKLNRLKIKGFAPFDFFILLCAFVYGNIFTIQCSKLNWGFLLIFGVIFFIEILDKLFYFFLFLFFENKKKTKNLHKNNQPNIFVNAKLLQFQFNIENILNIFFLVNTLKRGFFLGFFLEAFKVGS
jgi:hypothetical protein